jgi:hypothetical protein
LPAAVHRALFVLLAFVLAGCADPAPAGAEPTPNPARMGIVGLVQDTGFGPVPGATVTLRHVNSSTTTDAAGTFRFPALPISAYLVDVAADGFLPATLTAEPTSGNASLNFVLQAVPRLEPIVETTHFQGHFDCAMEALIIPGSCDLLLETAGGPSVVDDTSIFQMGMAPGWKSIVVDVDFDPSPGLDGLRLTLRGVDARDQLTGYEQYGRFSGTGPFTARLDADGTYPHGVGPIPGNLTALELAVYPQGHGYHAVCDPTGSQGCFLGVGAALNVRFDLYISIFYNQAAPDGYTLLGA